MANPYPFVAGAVLTAAELNGIGEYTAYTPTLTNLTLGNGTLSFRFGRVNKFIHVIGRVTFGSTTSITGSVTATLPVTATFDITQSVGLSRCSDATGDTNQGRVSLSSSTICTPNVDSVSGARIITQGFSATVPFTWTTSDSIAVAFYYEAA